MSIGSAKGSTPSLNTLYFYLTEGCNLACRHCWLAPKLDPTASKTPVLPVATFEAAIREAKPLGLSGVKLTGGEPLMHPQISDILKIIQREKLGLSIETNGMLCTPQITEQIANSPNRGVSVSVDGIDAATHEYVRNIQGSYERTLEGIRNLVASGVAPQIIMSVMRCNADQIEAMVRWAEKIGADSVKFNIIQPTERGLKINEGSEGLEIEDYIELGRYVENALSTRVKIPLYFDYPMAFRSLHHLAGKRGMSSCGIRGILGVLASGHYALCGVGQHTPDLVFGTIGEDSLETVWAENATLVSLRTDLSGRLKGICSYCIMKYKCLGACVAQNYYRSGELLAPYWFCEQAEEKGIFPASRKMV